VPTAVMADGAARAAIAVIKEHYGEACCMVYRALSAREGTLKYIADSTGLPLAQVRESVTWLLQHDIITFTPPPEGVGARVTPNVYRVVLWRALMRVRLPRCLHFTGTHHGELAATVVETMALQGRIRLRAIVTAVQQEKPEVRADEIKETLQLLLRNRLVYGRDGVADADAKPLTEDSFGLDIPVFSFSPGAADAADAASGSKRRLSSSSPLTTPKRLRRDSADAVAESAHSPIRPPSERYFAINYRQFQRCFFANWAVGYIAKTVDPACGEVLRAMFDAVLLDDAYSGERSRSVTQDEVVAALPRGRFTSAEFGDHMEALDSFGSNFITRAGGRAYIQLNYAVMRDTARFLAIEKMVEVKLDEECARLFRLVRSKRYIEQKKVKELALMGAFKDTKVSLNRLLKGNFLTMQEIPKQNDRVPSKCVYVWTCDMNRVTTLVLHQCYKAQANLGARAAVERREYRQLRLKQEKATNSAGEHADQQRAKADREALEVIEAKLAKLARAALEIDEQVMVLRDFDEMPWARRHEALLPRPVK